MKEEIQSLFIKVLIPSLVAVGIKIAIVSRKKSITVFNVLSSIMIGVGSAYLFSDFILDVAEHKYVPLLIALVTISGEKLGNWLIFKFNVDGFIEAWIEKYYKK